MFKKKVEEYAKGLCKTCTFDTCRHNTLQTCAIKESLKQAYQQGAEFGNKANEWHFVSKEGFPNKDDIYLIIRSDGLHLGDYCCGGDGDIDCQSWCDYPSEEEIQDASVIAWKEIELPKENE